MWVWEWIGLRHGQNCFRLLGFFAYGEGPFLQVNLIPFFPGLSLCLGWWSEVIIFVRKGSGTKVCGH